MSTVNKVLSCYIPDGFWSTMEVEKRTADIDAIIAALLSLSKKKLSALLESREYVVAWWPNADKQKMLNAVESKLFEDVVLK
jgi:hypothetical protein